MGANSGIAWTHHTFNPWMGCLKISEACRHCYAEVATPVRTQRAKGLELWGPPQVTARKRTSAAYWRQPVTWNIEAAMSGHRARVFCASLADVFENAPQVAAIREDLWALIESTPALDWLLLTKRPGNILPMVPERWRTAWPSNVWVGTTVETQERADERIPELLKVPALVRFLSVEPQLEAIDLGPFLGERWECSSCGEPTEDSDAAVCSLCGDIDGGWIKRRGLQWVITGGESGRGPRPYDLVWARRIVADCKAAGVPVFVKQLGARPEDAGAPVLLSDRSHGADPNEWPEDLRVQEFPR